MNEARLETVKKNEVHNFVYYNHLREDHNYQTLKRGTST